MLHMSPTCFYHIESLSWEQLANQGGWVPPVSDLIYKLNLILLYVSRIAPLERVSLSNELYEV